MRVIQVTATAEADGHIRLDIPTGAAGGTFDVAVVLHATPTTNGTGQSALLRTCGSIDDDSFDPRRPTDLPQTGVLE